jgi:proteasome lid subunit RPN8/RPN11
VLRLEIPKDIVETMVEHAQAEAPLEACGILAGRQFGVQMCYRMKNQDRSGDHFMMEPAEQFKVAKQIRAAGLEIVAIYHSHPQTPAWPSDEDIRLALTPGVTHVILSLADPTEPVIKGYEIIDGRINPRQVAAL